jgi:hypothetical protein
MEGWRIVYDFRQDGINASDKGQVLLKWFDFHNLLVKILELSFFPGHDVRPPDLAWNAIDRHGRQGALEH